MNKIIQWHIQHELQSTDKEKIFIIARLIEIRKLPYVSRLLPVRQS